MYRLKKKFTPLALSAAITIQITGCSTYDIVIDTPNIHITDIGNGILNSDIDINVESNIPEIPIEETEKEENNPEVIYNLDGYHYDKDDIQKSITQAFDKGDNDDITKALDDTYKIDILRFTLQNLKNSILEGTLSLDEALALYHIANLNSIIAIENNPQLWSIVFSRTDETNTIMTRFPMSEHAIWTNSPIHWETMKKNNHIRNDYGTTKTYHSF